MSLINDALKKAQRQRAADDPVGSTVASGLARRSQPKTSQSIALIAAGAVVLVAGSVAGTLFLLNRSAPSQPTPVEATLKATPTPAPSVASPAASPLASNSPVAEKKSSGNDAMKPSAPLAGGSASTPVTEGKTSAALIAPKSVPPTTIANKAATSSPVASAGPSPNATLVPAASNPPPQGAPPGSTAAPAPALPTPPPVAPATSAALEERIHAFLEALKIAGARAAGPDSRVLMNDRFYRLNEIVDRNLQLRLIKVEANSLTFSDANGTTYVRYF
jgi:hypothetical protein